MSRYNICHMGLAICDAILAYQCFRLSLSADGNHAESFNNLGVLELRKGNVDQVTVTRMPWSHSPSSPLTPFHTKARAFFQTSAGLGGHLFEPNYNLSTLAEKSGDLQTSYVVVQRALKTFPAHRDSAELLKQLQRHFSML